MDFSGLESFQNSISWQKVNQCSARDAERGIVSCPIEGGAYIVMPTSLPVIGEEALFWASSKEVEKL